VFTVFFPAKNCQFDKTKNIGKKKGKEEKKKKKTKEKRTKNKEKNSDTGCEENTLKSNEKLKLEISTEKPNWTGLGLGAKRDLSATSASLGKDGERTSTFPSGSHFIAKQVS
jgi:predicted sugar kinase